jgi:hypothetical protein
MEQEPPLLLGAGTKMVEQAIEEDREEEEEEEEDSARIRARLSCRPRRGPRRIFPERTDLRLMFEAARTIFSVLRDGTFRAYCF